MPKFLFAAVAVAAFWPVAAHAQKPASAPLSESDLLRQIETLVPPSRPGSSAQNNSASPASLFESDLRNPNRSAVGKSDAGGEKKSKGPTEITALEATFDQKANLAVFIGSVVVKDPEFNVSCDKLTAHLKSEKKPAGEARVANATPKPEAAGAKKKGGGLERAVAESTSERRVIITQAKLEADGTTTNSVGKADRATYDAVTGDIVLTGSPDVTQGINRVQATDSGTVMTLNRDGHMKAVGPHKTTIVEKIER